MMCCPGVSGGCSHCHTLRQQHYGVQMWLDGDPGMPPPPMARKSGRNKNWHHLVRASARSSAKGAGGVAAGNAHAVYTAPCLVVQYNADVISMPDKWEYPWYATWDLAFHCIPLCLVDPEWAKRQLILMLREWYMHPSGQIPAYVTTTCTPQWQALIRPVCVSAGMSGTLTT